MKEKKKNIFDTDIEMIDLDSVGDLEFRYEELGAPNQELSDDLNMVMKETQVFSSDEIEKALEKNAVEDMQLDLGQTRVIDSVEEIEGFLSEEEYDILFGGEETKPVFRFRIVELWQKIWGRR